MIVDCGERMLRMLQIAQRRLQVLSDPRARLLSHTDAAALVICSDNRRAGGEESPGTPFINGPTCRTRSACCARATSGHAAALPCPAMNSRRRILDPRADQRSLPRGRLQGNGVTLWCGPVQAPPPSAVASGRWGAPVAEVMWPTIEGRATSRRRPLSKQVPPWRPRSSAAHSDP
jgi:hypothetical protein